MSRSTWLTVALATSALALLASLSAQAGLRLAGRPLQLRDTLLGEAAMWLAWLALLPAIATIARRCPPFGERALRNAFIHAAAALAFCTLVVLAVTVIRSPLPQLARTAAESFLTAWPRLLATYAATAGLSLALLSQRTQQMRRQREARLEVRLAGIRRDLRRTQLHPHFLSNTLQTIAGLMARDVPAARTMVVRLRELLRLSLAEAATEVTLEAELELLRSYVDMHLIPFGGRVTVSWDIAPETRPLLVPRLILQPIVENAFMHGLAHVQGAGRLAIRSRVDGANLVLCVENDGPGPAPVSPPGSGGLGLSSACARMEQLYGDAAHLVLLAGTCGGATARIVLPAHLEPMPPPFMEQELALLTP